MKIYVVRSGDFLWRISQAYGSDLDQILLVNQLENPNTLVVGQALVIPERNREHVVQPGENLWIIASRYGLSLQELANFNNINNPSLIFQGQMLQLPYFFHKVMSGETLWKISSTYGVPVNQLAQANSITNPAMISSGQILRIPAPKKTSAEVNGYITRMTEQGRLEVLTKGNSLTYLSPFSYSVNEDGSLSTLQDALVLQGAEATNTSSLLTITNTVSGNFNTDRAALILRNPDLQESVLTNSLRIMKEKKYSGLNIDFEYVYPEDRENYTAFLRRAVARLHPEGFTVSTALAPKISAEQQGLLYVAHDYKAQGEIVDFIVLMTYEWGWSGGRPWAIAPITEVRKVLDYAVTAIPPGKILMGVPLYGRDWKIPWVQGTRARTVNPQAAIALAAKYGVEIQYDQNYQSPFFRYTDEAGQQHEVWFEDARSVQAKFELVKEYRLRGVSFWVLGVPFPQNWPVLQNAFSIEKQ